MSIVSALARKSKGLSRDEISKLTKVRTGGELSKLLNELEWCGFIRKYNSIGKQTKDALYQLIDNFTLFHFSSTYKGIGTTITISGQTISEVQYTAHGVDLHLNVSASSTFHRLRKPSEYPVCCQMSIAGEQRLMRIKVSTKRR